MMWSMFYVSSVANPREAWGLRESVYDKIGITDSKTEVQSFHTNKSVFNLLKGTNKIPIYGTYVYGADKNNMYVFCTPQLFNVKLNELKLRSLLEKHKKQHNPWSEYPIADYLASLRVGSQIRVSYTDFGTAGQMIRSTSSLSKIDDDVWYFEDIENMFSYRNMDSYSAASVLDYAWCGTRTHMLFVG